MRLVNIYWKGKSCGIIVINRVYFENCHHFRINMKPIGDWHGDMATWLTTMVLIHGHTRGINHPMQDISKSDYVITYKVG